MLFIIRSATFMILLATQVPIPHSGVQAAPGFHPAPSGHGGACDGEGVAPASRNRLIFTPDARPMEPGSGYVALHELFLPFAGIGITDFFSVGGGVSLAPGLDRQYLMLMPKVTPYATNDLALSAGATYIGRWGEEGTGIVYADATAGGEAGSGTFGLGWGFAGDGIARRPVILAGFRAPVADGHEIVSENWFPPNFDPAIVSIGWRYSAGEFSADVAVVMPARLEGGAGAPLIPWISFAYGF